MPSLSQGCAAARLPVWVPEGAAHYLAHVEQGFPIRALAREKGCHASTILRQVRRIEAQRDDPLVDGALRGLSRSVLRHRRVPATSQETCPMSDANAVPDEATLTREATRILRRLCEPGAVLAVSAQMDQAVVVRGDLSDDGLRTATVARTIAEVMALKSWISCDAPDRISRYRITPEGRSALGRMMADAESAATPWRKPDPAHAQRRPRRAPRAETPLMLLARRREKSGDPFLSPDLVHAGERFREDFELSQLGPRLTQDWDKTALGKIDTTSGSSAAPGDALRRFEAAKADLGDGLADVTVRCCCHLIGLETIEKEMGWSARSGKIVLRIALQRLLRHYQDTGRMDVLVG